MHRLKTNTGLTAHPYITNIILKKTYNILQKFEFLAFLCILVQLIYIYRLTVEHLINIF